MAKQQSLKVIVDNGTSKRDYTYHNVSEVKEITEEVTGNDGETSERKVLTFRNAGLLPCRVVDYESWEVIES